MHALPDAGAYSAVSTATMTIPVIGNATVFTHNFQLTYPLTGYWIAQPFIYGDADHWISVAGNATYRFSFVFNSGGTYRTGAYLYVYEHTGTAYGPQYGLLNDSRVQALGNDWYYAWGTFTTAPGTTMVNLSSYDYRLMVPAALAVANVSLVRIN